MSTTSLFLRKSPSRPHQTAPFVLMSHDNFPILSPSGVKEMEKPCQLALHAVQVMEQATLKRWEVSNHWKNILSNKKKKNNLQLTFHITWLCSFPDTKVQITGFSQLCRKAYTAVAQDSFAGATLHYSIGLRCGPDGSNKQGYKYLQTTTV